MATVLCMLAVFLYRLVVLFVFFFFQAEDGIRDLYVTGVQTCALPIYADDSEDDVDSNDADADADVDEDAEAEAGEDAEAEDRKSTRLNSSHVEISYAVFCLKKKKKEQAT